MRTRTGITLSFITIGTILSAAMLSVNSMITRLSSSMENYEVNVGHIQAQLDTLKVASYARNWPTASVASNPSVRVMDRKETPITQTWFGISDSTCIIRLPSDSVVSLSVKMHAGQGFLIVKDGPIETTIPLPTVSRGNSTQVITWTSEPGPRDIEISAYEYSTEWPTTRRSRKINMSGTAGRDVGRVQIKSKPISSGDEHYSVALTLALHSMGSRHTYYQ